MCAHEVMDVASFDIPSNKLRRKKAAVAKET